MKSSRQSTANKMRAAQERWLMGALVVSMTIATGPGVLLVNRPGTLFGFPVVYVWGVAWYLVLGALAVATDRLVWRKDCEREDEKSDFAEGGTVDDADDGTPKP